MVMGFSSYLLLLFAGLALCSPWVQVQGKTLPYMTSNVSEVSGKSFDYIIVGGGAGGCPLAATLSEKFSVLLVERGGSPFGNPLVTDGKNYGLSLLETDQYTSIAQTFVSGDGVSLFRGRILGGSTAINGAFYSRASEASVERLGWDKERVLDAYQWVESRVVFEPVLTPWQRVGYSSFIEAGVLPGYGFRLDHVEGTKVGGTMFDEQETRYTAADLLDAGNPNNITVLLNATVQSVIFRTKGKTSETIARGIRFIESDGNASLSQTYEAYLKQPNNSRSSWGDVILAAGALGSPQILLLSGIGPRKELQKFNISVAVDLKGVGKLVNDIPSVQLLIDPNGKYFAAEPTQVAAVADDSNIVVEAAILPTSLNATRMPFSGKVAFPLSKGKLELNTTDPRDNPLVTFNYFSNKKDLAECVKFIQLTERVTGSESVASFVGPQPIRNFTENELINLCRTNVTTYNHYHGGCTVGSVVDEDYRVYGVKGLRVVDGSTLLESPGTNPVASVLMLGRYQGVKILQERENMLEPVVISEEFDQLLSDV